MVRRIDALPYFITVWSYDTNFYEKKSIQYIVGRRDLLRFKILEQPCQLRLSTRINIEGLDIAILYIYICI